MTEELWNIRKNYKEWGEEGNYIKNEEIKDIDNK